HRRQAAIIRIQKGLLTGQGIPANAGLQVRETALEQSQLAEDLVGVGAPVRCVGKLKDTIIHYQYDRKHQDQGCHKYDVNSPNIREYTRSHGQELPKDQRASPRGEVSSARGTKVKGNAA